MLQANVLSESNANQVIEQYDYTHHVSYHFPWADCAVAHRLSSIRKRVTLNSGAVMPAIGLGTWQSQPGAVEMAVEWALRCGYRHIDTAFAYGNEKEVGQGIRASGVPREEIWLTTKLDNDWHHRVLQAIDESLKNLGVDYVDLYLMHWPASLDPNDQSKTLENWDYMDTWREMQKLLDTNKVRNIGVSNFGITHLERLLSCQTYKVCNIGFPCRTIISNILTSDMKVVPTVNQVELHPYNPSPKLLDYCTAKGIHLTAYCPLGSTDSPLHDDALLKGIAKKHGVTVHQVLLAWGVQRGTSVLPKSVTRERIEANLVPEGWQLSEDEMKDISGIQKRFKVTDDSWLPHKVFFGDDE